MNLLAAALYDPAVAVTKSTATAIAMTALDTTNLRLSFTVPASGKVRVRMMSCIHGATTFPSILLGVMSGATVKGRVTPVQSLGNTAVATALVNVEADFIVTGETPGAAVTWDAAYGVETVVASTGLKYGGPNNTTANDAFGAFCFEIWDVAPNPANFGLLSIDANGRIDVIKIAGTTQTARDLGASVLLSSGTGTGQLDFTSGVVKANTTQWLGSAVSTPTTAGVPNVNAKTWNDLPTVALPLVPTVAGRTLDVSVGGEAGLDFANIGSPTTVVNLSGTTIKTATDVETNTQDIQNRLPAALTVGGNIKADTLALSGDTIAADNAESFFDGTGYAGTNNVIPTVTTVTNQVTANMAQISGDTAAADNLEAALDGTGGVTFTATLAGNVNGNLSGSVGSLTTNNDKTGYSVAVGGIGAGAHTANEINALADGFLDRNMATGTDSGTDSTAVRTVRQALRPSRNKVVIANALATTYKEDDTTISHTATVTTTAGNPISQVDPTN